MALFSRGVNVNGTAEAVYLRAWKPNHERGALKYVLRRFWVGFLLVGGFGTIIYVVNLIAAIQDGAPLEGIVALAVWLVSTLLGGALVTWFWFLYRDKKYQRYEREMAKFRSDRSSVWEDIDQINAERSNVAPAKKRKNYEIYTSYPRSKK